MLEHTKSLKINVLQVMTACTCNMDATYTPPMTRPPRPGSAKMTRARRERYIKRWQWPYEIARIAVRQHTSLDFALVLFGPYVCGEEIMRRHQIKCQQTGREYIREDALDAAAEMVGMTPNKLDNWLKRSKKARAPKRY